MECCTNAHRKDALDLINRLKSDDERNQKRISNLKHALFEQQSYTAKLQMELATAKSEAYREFAEKLLRKATFMRDEESINGVVRVGDIYETLEEMG